jgi:hypothetical protein
MWNQESIPATLGGGAAARWEMKTLCLKCDGVDKRSVDIAAEAQRFGNDYSTKAWMIAASCQRCGQKLSMYDGSPNEPIITSSDGWGKQQARRQYSRSAPCWRQRFRKYRLRVSHQSNPLGSASRLQ